MSDMEQAEKLMRAIEPLTGMMRATYRCDPCGRIFGRQFIPYGIGHGLSFNLCHCQLTSNNVRATRLAEAKP